jgi:hypothetical protein
MHHGRAKALRTTKTTTLGQMLADGWLNHITHTERIRIQCSDEHPQPDQGGMYAECLRCELIACQDPRQEARRGSRVEIETEVQVFVQSWSAQFASTG